MISVKENPDTADALLNILHPHIKAWFFSKFKEFSLPQLYGVMEVHKRQNILISAPTGATKTLTGFLSILNELIDSAEKGILEDKIYCVYISPLKALSNDIHKNLVEPLKEIEAIAGKKFNIRVAVRTGDTTAAEKAKMLKQPPHILITTPESVGIVLSSAKFSQHLHSVDWVIVDEIHALAENKRGVHLSISLERLATVSPHLVRIGLSATISPLEEIAKFLVGYDVKNNSWRQCSIVDVQFIKQLDLKIITPVHDLINTSYEKLHSVMYKLINELVQQHKTTLIFTNTRSGTERVVHNLKEMFPKQYSGENIGAHHGSLGKHARLNIEEALRQGKMKCVVTSTSLELGIDIGFIDLVICLGSPKSVARFLQRAGRAGHQLHETVKARIIVMDRDDLVECSVLLKAAIERKIDRIHIPKNCLDVLSQQIAGIAVSSKIHIEELHCLLRGSYCFNGLSRKELIDVIEYLAGRYASLEDRAIYAKIWYDEATGMIGKRGKMSRVIYMTNIGTIPEERYIEVKIGEQVVGALDEAFLEKLKKGDIFVLGGDVYEFKYARGMTCQVSASPNRPPTVPSWFSEMLPLSFDLALEIGRFRRLMEEKLSLQKSRDEIISFVQEYLYVDLQTAESIYEYCKEQFLFSQIPHDKKILIEVFNEENQYSARPSASYKENTGYRSSSSYRTYRTFFVFHTIFGRRVNDALSRAVAFAISRMQHRDVDIGISDNGFFISCEKRVQARKAFDVLKSDKLRQILENAIDKTEILARRFRHCAARALMILRSYAGKQKRVGKQQVSSMILLNAVKRIDQNFSILREARREVLEDLMDIDNATLVLRQIEEGKIKVKETNTSLPGPFALSLVSQGHTDTLRIEDRMAYLMRMHQMVLAKIALNRK